MKLWGEGVDLGGRRGQCGGEIVWMGVWGVSLLHTQTDRHNTFLATERWSVCVVLWCCCGGINCRHSHSQASKQLQASNRATNKRTTNQCMQMQRKEGSICTSQPFPSQTTPEENTLSTSYQARVPAELKHINKRRKRN